MDVLREEQWFRGSDGQGKKSCEYSTSISTFSSVAVCNQLTIRVKKKDRTSIPAISTSVSSASLASLSVISTPIDSPATRESTGTPALHFEQPADPAITSQGSNPLPNKSTFAVKTILNGPPAIFTSFTKGGESFHVFPHKGSVKLVASIIVSLLQLRCQIGTDNLVFWRSGCRYRARRLHHCQSRFCSSNTTFEEVATNHGRNLD
jgi:hypothetical protein